MGILIRVAWLTCVLGGAALVVPAAAATTRPFGAAVCAPDRVSSTSQAAVASAFRERPGVVLRTVADVHRNDKADMTFASRSSLDGAFRIEGRGGDFAFHKTVRQNGSFTLELETSQDKVAFAAGDGAVTVTHGETTITLTPQQATEEDLGRVQRLLADSPAVRLSRVAASALQDSGDDSPEAIAGIVSDAFVGMLTGDPGAPARVARHLTRHLQSGMRRAAVNCYGDYEMSVWNAWLDYGDCLDSFAVWNPVRWACSLRYLVMAESDWFQFMSCIGLNGY
jgi:hypothetical protein